MLKRTLKRLSSKISREYLERLIRPAIILGGGNVGAAVLNFMCVAVASASLGIDLFGKFVIIQTTVLILESLFKFPTWQPIIYFYNQAEKKDIRALLDKSYSVEGLTSIISFLFFLFYVLFLSRFFNLRFAEEGIIYGILLLFKINGPSIAVFRIFNEFKFLSYTKLASSALKLILYLWIAAYSSSLFNFILALTFVGFVEQFLLFIFSRTVLKSLTVPLSFKFISPASIFRDKPFVKYLFITNLHVSVKVIIKHLDIIVISYVLGDAGAGLLKIVKNFGIVFKQLIDPLFQVLFPFIASSTDDRKKVIGIMVKPMKYLGLFCAVFTGLFVILGQFTIDLFFGEEYLVVFWPTVVFLLAASIEVITISFHPTLLSYNKPGLSLKILSLTSVAYFGAILGLAPSLGVMGVSISYLIFYIAWSIIMYYSIKKLLSNG
ncbi:MAG: hypothetical protein HEP71_28125 [Roseivirga sp.]|nr:hypothetical protein [Roseivirga sp.]